MIARAATRTKRRYYFYDVSYSMVCTIDGESVAVRHHIDTLCLSKLVETEADMEIVFMQLNDLLKLGVLEDTVIDITFRLLTRWELAFRDMPSVHRVSTGRR